MNYRKVILALSLVCSSACWGQANSGTSPASAQSTNAENSNNVCRVYFTKAKPGMEMQLEQGRKKHVQFHKNQNDTWTWNVYLVETGLNTGMYVSSTCGHAWKDFDDWEKRMGQADAADATTSMGPYIQSQTSGFYAYRADMSRAPMTALSAPLTAVTIFVLHPGAQNEFIDAVKKVNDALAKQPDRPRNSGWLQLMNGGEGPEFVLLSARQGYADYAPPAKTLADVLTEAYGKEAADTVEKSFRDAEDHTFTETAAYRPDLSYTPK